MPIEERTINIEMIQPTRHRPSLAKWLGAVAVATTMLTACGEAQTGAAAAAPPTVRAATVLSRHVRPTSEFNGHIEAIGDVELRPRVSGYIDSVEYVEGQEVKQGDVLFVIDDRSYRAELSRASADLARARTQVELTRSEEARAKVLSDQKAISTEMWEERRAAYERAVADVQAAEAAVEQARLNLEWTRVVAPVAGRVGRALITPGNLVTPGDVLATLVTMDEVYVHFDVDEATFLRFVNAQRDGALPARIGLTGEHGFPHEASVDFIDNRVSRRTGTIGLRAVLDNAERRFTPGLFARVQLPISDSFDALLIHDRSVLTDQDRKYVYIVDADGNVQRRDVQLGGTADGLRIVQEGLAAGDRVVVEGAHQITRPGMPVSVQEFELAARAGPGHARAPHQE